MCISVMMGMRIYNVSVRRICEEIVVSGASSEVARSARSLAKSTNMKYVMSVTVQIDLLHLYHKP